MGAAFGTITEMLTKMEPDEVSPNVDSGNPITFFCELAKTDQLETGVWRCTEGGWTIASFSVDEVMVILSGRVRLTASDGTVNELAKGDMFFVPKGWSGRWDTLEEMEKAYVIVY